ncbi:SMC superfamily protein [Pseudoalteromonas phage KB12-38]|nr:SMC superfamily protein [Pseudoalteromonas phage KB12-38]
MSHLKAVNAEVGVETQLHHSDDNLMDLIALRFSELQLLEAEQEILIGRNLGLHIERNAANKVVRELSEQNKAQHDQLAHKDVVIEGLKAALEAVDPQFDKLVAKINRLENENTLLSGKVERATKDLKNIKKVGDPNKLITTNKTMRATNSDLTKQLKIEQAENRKLKKENTRIQEFIARTTNENSSERLIYSNENQENLYLHYKTLRITTFRGTNEYVCLKYWNKRMLGRVVIFDGEKLNSADSKDLKINELIELSNEANEFAVGWFKKFVVIDKDGNQSIKNN